MITKEKFKTYISEYQKFEKGLERFSEALSGSKYGIPIFECDWAEAVGEMLECFLISHLTVDGADWVTYYMFEDIEDKKVTVEDKGTEIEYHLNSIDELWDFLLTNKERYFKNV